MDINLQLPISHLMSTEVIFVKPDDLMTEVEVIFKSHPIHHLPVLEEDGHPAGVISKHDYFQLQHHFSRMKWPKAMSQNERLFSCELVSDVMSSDPVCLNSTHTLADALDVFLENMFHCILVCEDGVCVGILTPYDILKYVRLPSRNLFASN